METVIQKIFASAARYPSADNNQPFQIEPASGNEYSILHSQSRAQHPYNIQNYVSDIVLGALKAYLEISAFRYERTIEFGPLSPCLGHSTVGNFTLTTTVNSDPVVPEFVAGLDHRYTERRPFRQQRPPPDGFTEIMSREEKRSNGHLAWRARTNQYSELLPSLQRAERILWSSDSFFNELIGWIRVNAHEAQITQDGLPISTIGIPFHSRLFLKLLKRKPQIYPVIKSLGLIAEQVRILKKAIKTSSLIGVAFVPPKVSFQSRLAVGESFTRTWLWLSGKNWALQPVSFATQIPTISQVCELPDELKEFQSALNQAINDFNLVFTPPKGWLPLWAFRAGPTDELKPLPRTLRRPLLRAD